jgi:site-specific recombinase XerD
MNVYILKLTMIEYSKPMTELTENLLKERCDGLKPFSFKSVRESGETNGLIICNYIAAVKTERRGLSDNYRRNIIANLSRLSRFHKNKPFKAMKRENVIAFLNQLRKPDSEDPLHKWNGSYNQSLTLIISFFKWLYYPNDTLSDRPKPDVVTNIVFQKRLEVSIYKPSDMWSLEDDTLFLKYCHSKRLKCYHVVSRDTGARPHELTKLKIRDVQFRLNGDGTQYAECLFNGKTGARYNALINSIPYVKDYLDHEHPQPTNDNAPFISAVSKSLAKHLPSSEIFRFYSDQKKCFV